MNTQPSPFRPDQRFWELHQSASNLTQYACMVSARYIKDGVLRGQFNRDMAYYVRQVLEDVRNGRVRTEDAQKAIEFDWLLWTERALVISRQGIGLVAGSYQFVGGAVLCATGAGCVVGLPLALHGASNVYENFENLRTGRDDIVGPVRTLYQKASIAVGGNASHGNMAYWGADIGLSVHGLLRKVRGAGSWKLFREVESDFVRAYTEMGRFSISVDVAADVSTAEQAYQESKK